MTKSLIIITLFFTTFVYGQVSKESIYKKIDGLTIVDSIAWKDIVGGIYVSDGFGGYSFLLDSNMTFQKRSFDCVSNSNVDSGSWSIQNKNTIVLNSSETTLNFDVIKFDKFLFFILPTQRKKFIDDIKAARIKLKNTKSFIFNKTYTADYFIAVTLIKKYCAKEIENIAGT